MKCTQHKYNQKQLHQTNKSRICITFTSLCCIDSITDNLGKLAYCVPFKSYGWDVRTRP